MKKLFVFLVLILCCLPSYGQIWEGNGGRFIDENIRSGSGSGGGWTPNPLDPNMTHYVISFKDDNQTTSLFSSIELNENTIVDLSVFAPSRTEGYDFSHWEDSNGNPITSVTMTADTTVYAVWTVHTHSITWQVTDYSKEPAAVYTSVDNNVAYGSIIVASSTPSVPQNYEFSGWNNLPVTMPDYDLVVTGTIDYVDIVFTISEIYDTTNLKRYPITYQGTITNYSPISYDSNGVLNMGSWNKWINNHFTPVMLKSDGTVDYELNRSNQNYKADGVTPSDVANANYDGNAMLQIKKFYISCSTTTEGTGGQTHNVHTIRISDSKKDNTYTCWGFVDADGVEHDYAYYALYLCHIDSNSKLRSLSGITLSSNKDENHLGLYNNIVTAARANGNGWSISNLPLENAIGLVMMMIYKETNPMFVAHEVGNNLYTQSADVNKITGTRDADGGFPYTLLTQQPKVLWLESYWRTYDTSGIAQMWTNGMGSLKNANHTGSSAADQYLAYYKLNEPYDFTDPTLWTHMNNTTTYAYLWGGQSHYPSTLTLYDNILFAKGIGISRTAVNANEINSYMGGAPIWGTGKTYHLTDTLLPAKTGGWIRSNQYIDPAHYLGYCFSGNDSSTKNNGGKNVYGSGRLTYLPQPASLASFYSAQNLSTLSVPRNTLQIRQETESIDQIEPQISTDTMEVDK